MGTYVLDFQEIDQTHLLLVGGKGLHLGQLSQIEGIQVPEGFCVTTDAYKRILDHNKEIHLLLNQLSSLKAENKDQIRDVSREIRKVIEETEISSDIKEEVIRNLTRLGEECAYAVRSSATAEDLPMASFAGQQDTYLNIIGKESVFQHISKCWASLFTERAVVYRIQNGFDHHHVSLSVVIQQMVFPYASGIMFTADPITSNRKVSSIDASFGLGEALVSGMVDADLYKVRKEKIIEKKVSTKKLAVYALKEGGTKEQEIKPDQQNNQTLMDEEILQLAHIGKKIEDYFGSPQDIEWCLLQNTFYIVQSRPITTLYPVPTPNGTKQMKRVYMSFGHQQMMTDAIKPLGMSFLSFLSDIPLFHAGGRLFFDISHDLASSIGRKVVLNTIGMNDPLMKNAITSLIERKDFIKSLPHGKRVIGFSREGLSWRLPIQAIKIYQNNNPTIIEKLISLNESSILDLQQSIRNVSGDELFEFILQDQKRLKEHIYDPQSLATILVAMYAMNWINKNMKKWLGEKNVADTLSQSVSNNITSEMGLALLDVSDVVRQYPDVITFFDEAKDENFFEELTKIEGGEVVHGAMQKYLKKYGMRCPGEIDITKPRWSEQPTALIPMILSNIKNFESNASTVKFEQGRLEAKQKERDLLRRLEQLPRGKQKAKKTKKMIRVLRNFIGYREYPKYSFIRRYQIYKQALMKEATVLVQRGVIQQEEDIYYLSFEEFREVVRTNHLDYRMIIERQEEYAIYEKLAPPRIMTSEGEIIFGKYNTDNVPSGALVGIPVSSGIMEGRARIVLKMEEADIEDGDILVTRFTDPSWTPLFVSIKGLVTEVGGLMTHGSVIAREYGLPAVVGVENATKQIKDGQRIRVNGTEGYIEIL
ncbi:phosphoenolpyruvate synthase [Risungbinella massiliensis]|uniref:phosphoenolpyruvate synthase n=1 Tax=Risungbinella massiliensis TaxID=1329796 RepID=UPI0005CC6E09|nr:phosphoenolpyruvate synthase [Risungbinella massiliensis]